MMRMLLNFERWQEAQLSGIENVEPVSEREEELAEAKESFDEMDLNSH
jgi:hypothetical protein